MNVIGHYLSADSHNEPVIASMNEKADTNQLMQVPLQYSVWTNAMLNFFQLFSSRFSPFSPPLSVYVCIASP